MFLFDSFIMDTPDACTPDVTAPTFTGIQSATPQGDGSILVAWPVASDPSSPITYDIYCLPGLVTAAVLFSTAVRQSVKGYLDEYIYRDSNNAPLVEGVYTFGVRARDAVGNLNTNTALLSAFSTGVLTENLAVFVKTVKAVMANQASNIESKIDTDEVVSKIETQEVVSKVTVDPDIKC